MIDNTEATYDQPYSPSYEVRKYDILYIFFSNLDSPAGEKGELKFAQGRKSTDEILKQYTEKEMIETGVKNRVIERNKLGGSSGPDKYIYPYKTYAQSVTIDGAEVRAGMSLKELNKNRKSLGLNKFTFRDQNMNMINERGQTKGDKGEYWDDRRTNFCQKQGYYFYNSVQYSDYELEFIRVGYRTREDDENGKFYPFW